MHSDNFDISSYFKRINYTGPAAADTTTLHALMRHQLFSVPFENLDVQAGKIVSLAPDDIAEKVLKKGRGGYCYEVNGLFAMALDTLDVEITQDFDTFRLSRSAEGEYLLEAKVEGEWARQYGFDLTPQEWIDFVPANYLNSTHPDAIFVQKRVVVQHSPEGRQILLGDMLKTITANGTETRQLAEEDIRHVLKDRFALTAA
ncbi:TPA: arylamine N-acetyltransferase [Enterobacter roggenkampii]|nr:arylamine N-acetyltransferase [Enterobacter roggenkampii]